MKAKQRWYELLLPDLREFAKGEQKMKALDKYYKLILISMAIVVFLPLTTLMAEDYWDWYTYGTGDQSSDVYESSAWVTKDVDITENYLYRNFDEEYGTGYYMISGWTIDIYARVQNTPEEAYSNDFELEGEAYHYCQEGWEWTGPPAEAPGATIDFSLYTSGNISTDGDIYVTAGSPYIGATGDISCNAYSWPHDSQGSGYFEMDAEIGGSVSDSSNSYYRYWDCTPEKNEPSGNHDSGEDYFTVSYSYLSFSESDEYEIGDGIGTFSANGGAYAKGEASVGLIAYEGDTGKAEVDDYVYIYARSDFDMTSN